MNRREKAEFASKLTLEEKKKGFSLFKENICNQLIAASDSEEVENLLDSYVYAVELELKDRLGRA